MHLKKNVNIPKEYSDKYNSYFNNVLNTERGKAAFQKVFGDSNEDEESSEELHSDDDIDEEENDIESLQKIVDDTDEQQFDYHAHLRDINWRSPLNESIRINT